MNIPTASIKSALELNANANDLRRLSMRRRIVGKKISAALLVSIILSLCLLWTNHAYAQGAAATLTGTVSDRSGAVIPKAEISAKNAATGVVRGGETNSAGLYTVPGLA